MWPLRAEGLRPKKLIPVSPNLNAYVEHFIQTIEQECLDHFVVVGEPARGMLSTARSLSARPMRHPVKPVASSPHRRRQLADVAMTTKRHATLEGGAASAGHAAEAGTFIPHAASGPLNPGRSGRLIWKHPASRRSACPPHAPQEALDGNASRPKLNSPEFRHRANIPNCGEFGARRGLPGFLAASYRPDILSQRKGSMPRQKGGVRLARRHARARFPSLRGSGRSDQDLNLEPYYYLEVRAGYTFLK